MNSASDAAWRFHNATKYVRPAGNLNQADTRILMGELPRLGPGIGEQDPAIEPLPYKIYTGLDPIPLPSEFPASDLPALDALVASGELPEGTAIPNLETVARLCLRANGVLKRWRSPAGKEIEFRSAGCTGARYHLELYLVCGDLPGLGAGMYHYGAHDHALRRLREGDYRGAVIAATGEEPAVAAAPVVAFWTSTFWRNAWRYQARAYRHVYWDAGTVLANLLAVAADARLPTRVVLGFADDEINALLGVDGAREAAVALVALGRTEDTPGGRPIKVGIVFPHVEREIAGQTPGWGDVLAVAETAEAMGFDSFWLPDHLLSRPDGEEPHDQWECCPLLAALAANGARVVVNYPNESRCSA